jgi:diguanylate cyclase (GGDEF)-like protein
VIDLPGSRRTGGTWATETAELPSAIRSVLCVPLVSPEHGVIGVLELCNRIGDSGAIRESGFSEMDIRVLTEIASFLARGVLSFHELGHDPLTRLYNRRVLLDRTETEIRNVEKAGRAADLQTWFALADVDHFKLYNEISGYLVADGVLQDVARSLRESVREHDFVARFGGEEFCLILTRIEDRDQAQAVLDRIRKAVSDLSVPNAEKMPGRAVTISIGASQIRGGDVFRDVFQRANEAIRRAKTQRDAVVLEPASRRRRGRRKKESPPEEPPQDEE